MSPLLVLYAGAALTGIMIAETVYLLYSGRQDRRTAIDFEASHIGGVIAPERRVIRDPHL